MKKSAIGLKSKVHDRYSVIRLCIAALFFALFFNTPVYAQSSIALTPVRDNTLYQHATGAISNGSGQYLFAGNSGTGLKRRALLAFDVAGAISSEATVDSVRLTLTMSRTISGAQSIAIHRVMSDWGEGESVASGNEGGGGPAMEGDATWLHTFYDAAMWQTEGGDFATVASAVMVVADIDEYAVASSDGLAEDVRAWLADPDANFGWILIGEETAPSTAKRFNSRENDDTLTHPTLQIYYSTFTAVEEFGASEPVHVHPNYPNPFSASTTVNFDLDETSQVQMDVFDLLGHRVWQSAARTLPAGANHRIEIDGASLASGVYFYRLTLRIREGTSFVTRRMTVAR